MPKMISVINIEQTKLHVKFMDALSITLISGIYLSKPFYMQVILITTVIFYYQKLMTKADKCKGQDIYTMILISQEKETGIDGLGATQICSAELNLNQV